MELKQGITRAAAQSLKSVLEAAQRADTTVYELPEIGVRDRESFFEAVRGRMPLDPPVLRNDVWDALADSLWSGLHELESKRVVIVWPNATVMEKAAPDAFAVAVSVLEQVARDLASEKATVGRPKEICVILT